LGLLLVLGLAGKLVFAGAARAENTPAVIQSNPDLATQEQQGRERYEGEQFAAAAAIWQQVARSYQSQGDGLNQARVLSNLALAYQELGQWTQAQDAIATSLDLLKTHHSAPVLAQVLNTQGSLQLAMGQAEQALATWQQATAQYTQAQDAIGVSRSLLNQVQAMRTLGLYRRGLTLLLQVKQELEKQPDSLLKASALRSLGANLRVVGDPEQSRQALQQSLAIAQRLNATREMGAALLSLGNLARSQQETQTALSFYQQATAIAPSPLVQTQTQLNQLSLFIEQQQDAAAQSLLPAIQINLSQLPPSRAEIYARLNFARSLMKLATRATVTSQLFSPQAIPTSAARRPPSSVPPNPHPLTPATIAPLIVTAVEQSRSLGDRRAESYALGSLGNLYEQTRQWGNTQKLTQQALLLAQAVHAPEIAYRWQWQLGRLLKAREDQSGAIAAYTEAFKTLQALRSDLVTSSPELQFSFRDSAEPVYRELVSLLLQPGRGEPGQQALVQARQVIESLQLAELDNFFQEACLNTQPTQIDQVDPHAAVFYPIILEDRLEVVLSLPKQPLRHYATSVPQSQVEETVNSLRRSLTIRSKREFFTPSRQLYDWLIRPVEQELATGEVKTLAFVLDGVLRNIPMAALHDGNQFLIQKYSLALTPGLQLLAPQQLQRNNLRILTAGLTEARQGFSPLDNVETELQQIKSVVPGEMLLNQAFTRKNLQTKVQSADFPIVHIATHGQFSSRAADTFILTWDDRINVSQLDRLLQLDSPEGQRAIELLVFSACQTATGDKRAALGLAGVAVRAGARSTLATLWSVSDEATASLMSRFYRELASTTATKAEALRQAQLSLLTDPLSEHPIYWAPFVLVGNWL
jgi:CHAT domain-containing protein